MFKCPVYFLCCEKHCFKSMYWLSNHCYWSHRHSESVFICVLKVKKFHHILTAQTATSCLDLLLLPLLYKSYFKTKHVCIILKNVSSEETWSNLEETRPLFKYIWYHLFHKNDENFEIQNLNGSILHDRVSNLDLYKLDKLRSVGQTSVQGRRLTTGWTGRLKEFLLVTQSPAGGKSLVEFLPKLTLADIQ